jgi:hypothetical protein
MTEQFFERPILNSPYAYPARHWELVDGQPTNRIVETRRHSDLVTPVPKPKKRRRSKGIRPSWCSMPAPRALDRRAGIQPHPDHQRDPHGGRQLAKPPQPQ